jgi:RNA polymerase sigma factor (sigma-70 family)
MSTGGPVIQDDAQDDAQGDTSSAIASLLEALGSSADAAAKEAARATLVSLVGERMRALAGRMLAGSPRIRRWTETDDILQGAMLRLLRALGSVTPNDSQHFFRLAALQVRRELIDLTRRFGNPESFAANHDTNALADGRQWSDQAVGELADEPDRLGEWTRFHQTVDALPEPERDLFGMVWYLGLSQPEIAVILGCSVRTVRRRWDETKQLFIARFRGGLPN